MQLKPSFCTREPLKKFRYKLLGIVSLSNITWANYVKSSTLPAICSVNCKFHFYVSVYFAFIDASRKLHSRSLSFLGKSYLAAKIKIPINRLRALPSWVIAQRERLPTDNKVLLDIMDSLDGAIGKFVVSSVRIVDGDGMFHAECRATAAISELADHNIARRKWRLIETPTCTRLARWVYRISCFWNRIFKFDSKSIFRTNDIYEGRRRKNGCWRRRRGRYQIDVEEDDGEDDRENSDKLMKKMKRATEKRRRN